MMPFSNSGVARIFDAYPPRLRSKLLALRELIFATAASTAGVGEIEETLKWGEPAYLTAQSRSGSTIRIDAKKSAATQYAMYFNCKTDLVETFRTLFRDEFMFDGNRAIVFDIEDEVPIDALKICIAAALTYHRKKVAAR